MRSEVTKIRFEVKEMRQDVKELWLSGDKNAGLGERLAVQEVQRL